MDFLRLNLENSESLEMIKTKPVYGGKTFFWELESIESIMADGVQRAMVCDFDVSPTHQPDLNSRWRLTFDLVDIEPALTVEKLSPTDKMIFYRISVHVMRSKTEATDIISFPNAKLFYDSINYSESSVRSEDLRKFTLHKQLDYGSSYSVWFKDALVGDSLLLKVEFETCECIIN